MTYRTESPDCTVRVNKEKTHVLIVIELDEFYNIGMTPEQARGMAHLLEVKAREIENHQGRLGRAASDYKAAGLSARRRRENKGETSASTGEVRADDNGGTGESGTV